MAPPPVHTLATIGNIPCERCLKRGLEDVACVPAGYKGTCQACRNAGRQCVKVEETPAVREFMLLRMAKWSLGQTGQDIPEGLEDQLKDSWDGLMAPYREERSRAARPGGLIRARNSKRKLNRAGEAWFDS
ncbi:hypothetical protein MGYG_00627 [Nannizzia gypsea CBS 118893]|uniref:Uncharacterized protein n=1 Tax=Arthroderma gypseum (strain ATCC MYA-4604 / CBS 118893) TaxID=535722 RepID=E5R0T1_ARTGP|nr:hypothetical protein MGYG_00627 [Nannizzia gypsea CBS 118893]EFQ97587.1 hypothetical protein MGYG_00627 [Nannizzia gypsea CBS 118893]